MKWVALFVFVVGCGPVVATRDAGTDRALDAGARFDAGTADAGRQGSDGGTADAGTRDAGSPDAGLPDAGPPPDGGLCTPCVMSTDCLPGGLCLGGVTPRCTEDCSASGVCSLNATCGPWNIGTRPAPSPLCYPDEPPCPPYVVPASLSCTDDWASYGQTFFGTVCTGACHHHDGQWPTVLEVRAWSDGIRYAVETGFMPRDASLTPQERLRLLTWLACGAP